MAEPRLEPRQVWTAAEGDGMSLNVFDNHIETENQQNDPEYWRDKYLRSKQDNENIKRENHELKDKLTKMATKLLRITADLKRRQQHEGSTGTTTHLDRDERDMIDSLQKQLRERDTKIRELEGKLGYLKGVENMLHSRRRKYDHVKSQVDTGTTQKKLYPLMYQGPSAMQGSPQRGRGQRGQQQPQEEFYMDDAMDKELSELRELAADLSDKLANENRTVRDLQRRLDAEEGRSSELESRLKSQTQQTVVVPDSGLIEELRQKKSQLAALQSKMDSLESKFQQMKRNHSELLEQTERLNREYKEERRMRVQLQHDAERYENAADQIRDLNIIIDDLRHEKKTLEDEHAKILATALSGGEDKEVEVERRLNELQEQIKVAEAGRRVAHEHAQEALEKANSATEELSVVQETRRELEVKYYELKQENELLAEKLKYFTAESGIDFKELEEALALIRRRKESGEDGELNALELDTQLREIRAHTVELAQELERTQKMLQLQERLGREYQSAIEEKERLLKDLNRQLDEKRQDVARVVDRKEARIKELEVQMRNLLYRSKKVGKGGLPDVELNEGENVLECVVVDADLDSELLALDKESPVFAVISFYVHPAQATPIVKGPKPKFDCSMLYIVTVDNTFIGYLHEKMVRVEMCRARGLDYHVLASGELSMADLAKSDTDGSEWSLDLTTSSGAMAGSMRISGRMRMTIASSVQAFKESNAIKSALKPFDGPNSSHARTEKSGKPLEFTISIGDIGGLPKLALQDGQDSSVYCAYQFYYFGLYCTPHVGWKDDGSIMIEDTQKFPFNDNDEFAQYIEDKTFEILVLEDTPVAGSVDGSDNLYGRVDIGSELTKLKIGDEFDEELPIVDENGRTCGHVRVELTLDGPEGSSKPKKRVQIEDPKELYGDADNFVVVTVDQLKLEGPAMDDEVVEKSDLVVSYDFLCGFYDEHDTQLIETEYRKKKVGIDTLIFDHRRVFPIDAASHDRARWKLKSMMRNKDDAVITFLVEAVHGDEGVTLGQATLNLFDLVEHGDNPDGVVLEVIAADTAEKTLIGHLTVVTTASDALSAVLSQLQL